MAYSPEEIARFTQLYTGNIIPLRVVLASLTWVLYDYFETLEDEVRYIWSQKRCIGKMSYLFMRYYTILLLAFDVTQIHSFAIPGITSDTVCLAMDPTIRLLGAISLWSIEVIMQLRVYALFDCSKKVAVFNGVMFIASIVAFLGLLIYNAQGRAALIASAVRLPLPGCPAINGGIGWALWLPASLYETILFGFVVYKSSRSLTLKVRLGERWSLGAVMVGDNMLYFLGITVLLAFNNVMAAGAAKIIPWFSYGPFHAAMGIMTTRMLMNVRKLAAKTDAFAELSEDECSGGDGEFDGNLPRFVDPTPIVIRGEAAKCTSAEIDRFAQLYALNIIPLRVILGSLTFVLCDYLDTLEDEVRYIWPQKRSFGKTAYLFVRYYTIILLLFDVLQIHTFAIPGVTSNTVCVAIDPATRVAGAISLWAVEIIMQVRIYALYDCSMKVAVFNAVMFVCSIAGFLTLVVINAMRRASLIASAIRLPLPGCPSINGGTGWALWIPASGFELILFAFVVYKSVRSMALKVRIGDKRTLGAILIADNMLYFFGITVILAFTNAMAAGATKVIPWFSFGPFHATMGIMTTRMLMHLRKRSTQSEFLTHHDGIESDPDVNGDVLLVAFAPHSVTTATQDSRAGSRRKSTDHNQDSWGHGRDVVWRDEE